MDKLCTVCLSADRILYELQDYQDLYNLLIPGTDFTLPQVRICWECRSILRKCKQFQRNALSARDFFISYSLDPNLTYDENALLTHTYSTLRKKTQILCNGYTDLQTEPTGKITVKEEPLFSNETAYEVPATAVKLEDREMTCPLSLMSFNGDQNTPSPLPNLEMNDPLSLCTKDAVTKPTVSRPRSNATGKSLKLVPLDTLSKNLKCIKKLPGNCDKKPVKVIKVTAEHIKLIKSDVAPVKSGRGLMEKRAAVKTEALSVKKLQEKKKVSCVKHYVQTHRTIVPKEVLKAEMEKIRKNTNRLRKGVNKDVCGEVTIPTTKEIREQFTSAMSEEFRKIFTVKVMSDRELEVHRSELMQEPQYVNSQYKCTNCIIGYYTEEQLLDHNAAKHTQPNDSYVAQDTELCPTCRAYVPRDMFAFHYGRHRVLYQCDRCGEGGEALNDFRKMTAHSLRHDREKRLKRNVFACRVCHLEFRSRHRLRVHGEAHAPAQRYTCERCGKGFGAQWALRYHVKRHSMPADRVKCEVCDKEYKDRYSLAKHARAMHGSPKGKRHSCPQCGVEFQWAASLARHRTAAHAHVDHVTYKHICPTCGKGFKFERELRDHDNYVHQGRSDHICSYCHKMYSSAGGLSKHVKFVHEGKRYEKNKTCNVCGKAFTSPKTLREHLNIHNGTRPFKCLVCGDTFKQSSALYNHRRLVHLGYKMRNKKIVKPNDQNIEGKPTSDAIKALV